MSALMLPAHVTTKGAPFLLLIMRSTSFALSLDLWKDRKKPSIYYVLNELLPEQKQRG